MTRGPQANRLRLTRKTKRELRRIVRRHHAPFAVVQRVKMILLAARGVGTTAIARRLDCDPRTVRKWKARFCANRRAETLEDAPRSGRPSRTTVAQRCELVQLACERPDGVVTPFRQVWTYQTLSDALHARIGHRLSVSEVGRILRFKSIRPHRVRQWLKSRDPDC